jgi:dihydrofolate reductase
MSGARISAIAAIGRNRELGKNNTLSWRIKDDLERLRKLSMGHPIIMGRKTFESIGHPLAGRTNIIVTSNPFYEEEDCVVVHSVEEALNRARHIDGEEVFIFGGAQIYAEMLPFTDRLYLTLIDAEDPQADVFFPPYSEFSKVIEGEPHTDESGLKYIWLTLERPE